MDVERRFKLYQVQLEVCSSREQYDQVMRIIEEVKGRIGA